MSTADYIAFVTIVGIVVMLVAFIVLMRRDTPIGKNQPLPEPEPPTIVPPQKLP